MIRAPAAFPFPGSFGLLVDPLLPLGERRAELVRILEKSYPSGKSSFVSFPLRAGSSGNRTVPDSQLIDGTPLSKAEERELADLQRALRGRTRSSLKGQQKARADALMRRMQASILLAAELAKLERIENRAARRAGSPGQLIDTADPTGLRSAA